MHNRDRGRRGNRKPHGGLTVSGEAAAKQSNKPFKTRKEKGVKPLPEGNPAAFRTWYVPEGVDTGPSGHRNPDGRGKKPYAGKSGGGAGRGVGMDVVRANIENLFNKAYWASAYSGVITLGALTALGGGTIRDVLLGLFFVQYRGTGRMGAVFGPITALTPGPKSRRVLSAKLLKPCRVML